MLEEDVVAPEGWSIEPLAKCVDVLDSRRKPVNSNERAARPGSVPYYGATGQVGWIDDYLFDEELVLLGEDGAPFLDKSKHIAYVVDGQSWVNNHAHVLRARSDVTSNRYVKHYLDSFDFTHRVQGSTRDKLTQGSMNTIPILLAPRPMQEELVRTIDDVVARRSRALARLAVARRSIDRFRQAVLGAACSGRLTDDLSSSFDFEAFEREVSLARASLSPRLRKPLTIEHSLELPEIPDHWKWMTIDQLIVSSIQNGLYLPAARYGAGIPILRIEDFQLSTSRSRDELKLVSATVDEQKKYALDAGELVVNRVNSPSHLGKSLYVEPRHVPAVFESNMMRVRFRAPMNARYVNLYLSSLNGRRRLIHNAKWAVNQASINQTDVRQCPVPVPPPEEQGEIVRRVESLFAAADRLTNRIDAANKRVNLTLHAVLVKAFRGELLTPQTPRTAVRVS